MSKARTGEREGEFKKFLEEIKRNKKGFLKNALEWFKRNVGEIVTSRELAQITGKEGYPISHNLRRIFELRDELGYRIVNHKDNGATKLNLRVDEWVLVKSEPDPSNVRSRGVNKRIMYEVFSRDGNQCQFCGRTPNDDDPFKKGHKIKLHVGHIIAHKRENGKEIVKVEPMENVKDDHLLTKEDFVTMCNVCNEGAKNKDLEILSHEDKVERLDEDTQKRILEKLKKKFS